MPPPATIDPAEAAHFGALAKDWWEPKGSSAMLHRLNPARLGYIREQIDLHRGGDDAGGQLDEGEDPAAVERERIERAPAGVEARGSFGRVRVGGPVLDRQHLANAADRHHEVEPRGATGGTKPSERSLLPLSA